MKYYKINSYIYTAAPSALLVRLYEEYYRNILTKVYYFYTII